MHQKTIKTIDVNIDKCTGCRSCEMACSAFHAAPRYSSLNPARSRIRVFVDEINDLFVPVRGGNYAQTECSGRDLYHINAKAYAECVFCPAACPSRSWFKEPDSGLPLKCDMCEDTPPLPEPMCVQACKFGALTYLERPDVSAEDEMDTKAVEKGLESLTQKYGIKKVLETAAGMAKKE